MSKKINYPKRSAEAQARMNAARNAAKAIPHTVEGTVYPSLIEASRATGLHASTISTRIRAGREGYSKGNPEPKGVNGQPCSDAPYVTITLRDYVNMRRKAQGLPPL